MPEPPATVTVAAMSVRLTVERAAWIEHVHGTAAAYGHGLVPVVKGNGYGFGRSALHEAVHSAGARHVCVGTIHELHDVPEPLVPVVLTPTLAAPTSTRPVLTVGSLAHVDALHGWHGRVMVKVAGSMHRYGIEPALVHELVDACAAAALQVEGFAVHLPLAGDDASRLAEIDTLVAPLPARAPVWVSHLTPDSFHTLQERHPDRPWSVRVGTALWHGVPRGSFLRLTAEVLDVRPIRQGDVAGYRHTPAAATGWLVAVGAGSAAGVAPLDSDDPTRRSPFHFAQQRLTLLEAPHMHTSLVVVPEGQPCPAVGDRVDVQRPLTTTFVDEVVWT